MIFKTVIVIAMVAASTSVAWENLPPIPSGRRSQYFLLQPNGGYKYGYDTGVDHSAKQSASSNNEVAGHYFYTAPTGQLIDLKYTAGINGFVPEGVPVLPNVVPVVSVAPAPFTPQIYHSNHVEDDQSNTGDASYSFSIDTDSYKRQENSDAAGNVQGKYSYTNEAGTHEISYLAGSNTGFVASSVNPGNAESVNNDGSYAFSYNTGDSSRQEGADAAGNVQGRYSFTNEAGSHDLSYSAGADTGFIVTGGSLATPNGLPELVPSKTIINTANSADDQPVDGAYSFSYSNGDSSRAESADSSGNVQGNYAFTNAAGRHDLSYKAGSETGFVVTGGSLAVPNGLSGAQPSDPIPQARVPVRLPSSGSSNDEVNTGDASYKFSIDTDEYKREESADSTGNVQGHYSYKNSAGTHDLSYVAGADTGFVATGGSLKPAPGLTEEQLKSEQTDVKSSNIPIERDSTESTTDEEPSETTIDPLSDSGDSSYSFTIDTDEYKRKESSDASGNVKGSFSYKNSAGTHDLSYVAGSETGFVATGGSLQSAPGLTEPQLKSGQQEVVSNNEPSSVIPIVPVSHSSNDGQVNTGDASYKFSIDTDEYKRDESSDAAGNVKGSFSYKNSVGTHDLSYKAGSETGFVATGGSLQSAPGLTEVQLKSGQFEAEKSTIGGEILPNVIKNVPSSVIPVVSVSQDSNDDQANTGDASYKFSIDTDEYKRDESSDAAGNVKGSFSYKNSVGTHDLSYIAGSETGFVATGGSLQSAPGLTEVQLKSGEALIPSSAENVPPVIPLASSTNLIGNEASSGDGSYKFSIDTDEYKRHEESDASGNVKGTYSYKNSAGSHDLSYSAGAETGFVAEGGSLKTPPGLSESQLKSSGGSTGNGIEDRISLTPRLGSEESNGDSSYSFTIDTDDYKRQESSDASGNVKGHFSYKNGAGSHELSYVAGANTGFVATEGSLKTPPGLSEHQLKSGIVPLTYYPPQVPHFRTVVQTPFVPISPVVVPIAPNPGYQFDNFWIRSYLPPTNDKQKFGYVFDTQ